MRPKPIPPPTSERDEPLVGLPDPCVVVLPLAEVPFALQAQPVVRKSVALRLWE